MTLYYVVSDFNRDFQIVNENFGVIFFEFAYKPFTLYLILLEVFLKVFFNKMKVTSDFLINLYFSNLKAVPKSFTGIKKKIAFSLLKLHCETGLRFVKYLNLMVSSNAVEYMFISFKPIKDYRNVYLKIVNFKIR